MGQAKRRGTFEERRVLGENVNASRRPNAQSKKHEEPLRCWDCTMATQDLITGENFCDYYKGDLFKTQQRNGSKSDDFTFPADQEKPADCAIDEEDEEFGTNLP